MAILYGTTAEGDTLPVMVNAAGQLQAKGLQGDKGDKGDQGEQGEQGPVGVCEWIEDAGTWTPEFVSSEEGSALIDYDKQEGMWYTNGNFVLITFNVRTSGVLITDARGNLQVAGHDLPLRSSQTDGTRYGPTGCPLVGQFLDASYDNIFLRLATGGRVFNVHTAVDGGNEALPFTALDEATPTNNWIVGWWIGLSRSFGTAGILPLDDVL